MQQSKDELQKMLDRYRLGHSDGKERSGIISWLTRLDLWTGLTSEAELQDLQRRSLSELRRDLQAEQKTKPIRLSLWKWTTAAASIVLLVTLGIWYNQHLHPAKLPAAEWVWLSTQTGELKRVTLADGTTVTLNSKSALRYPRFFEAGLREVSLSGQAFFQVSPDPKRPFRIHAGRLDVQVLGTSFDVRAYADEPGIRVGVASGKVGVLVPGHPTAFLIRGQGLEYFRSNGQFSRYSAEERILGSWQQRRLTFKNQSLVSITTELQRYFKVRFVFDDQGLKEKKISLSIRNQNLETILKAMAASGNLRYRITGKVVTLTEP